MSLISHRGADSLAPANSIEGVIIADTFKPLFIEIDVNCTADFVIVTGHGPLKQEATGVILEDTYAEFIEKYPHISKIHTVFDLKLTAPLLLDIKTSDPKALKLIEKEIRRAKLKDFSFTSPHPEALVFLQKIFVDAPIYVTQHYHASPIKAIELARKHKFDGISMSKWQVNPYTMTLCSFYRKNVNVYTVDSALLMWLIQRIYPRVNIVTNKPQLYRKLFPFR